jgi:hypothetical protein
MRALVLAMSFAQIIWRRHLELHRIVLEADGLPESISDSILDENSYRNRLVAGPNPSSQSIDGFPANAASTAVSTHEELPQRNVISLVEVESIRHRFPIHLEDHGFVFSGQEASHLLFQPGDGFEAVAVSFIFEEFSIHPGE